MSKNYPIIQRIGTAVPLAADIVVDASSFGNILGAGDIDVQLALDTIDDLVIGDVSDVTITTVADNDVLQYNTTGTKWENITQANFVTGITPGNDTEVIFNDGGTLGAESGFVFDKTNSWLGLNVAPIAGITVKATVASNYVFNAQASTGVDWFTIGRVNPGEVEFNTQGGRTYCATFTNLGARMNIGALSASNKPLALRGVAAQTADLFDVQVDGGATVFKIGEIGQLEATKSIKVSAVETITAATDTLDDTNHIVLCDTTSNAITINLPAASGNTGLTYHIKKIDSVTNTVTVDANASETIDGATTQVIIAQYDSMYIVCDGSNWHII